MDTDEFAKQFSEIFELALSWSEIARREGLLALEDLADEEKIAQRDIFQFGIRLTVDGIDTSVIDKILTNFINLETDKDMKTLKTIQKEAVLGIQCGMNSRILAILLNSYVNTELTVALKD